MSKLSKRLRHLCDVKGFNQVDLAKKLIIATIDVTGMTDDELNTMATRKRSTVANWLNDRTEPDSQTLAALASIFDVSVDYLIGRPENSVAVSGGAKKLPIIGTVKAGADGLAYQEMLGYEYADNEDIPNGSNYFWLKVKGESMINEGILPGDLALVREQPQISSGELAVVVVDGEEGTLKRVYFEGASVILQSANPSFPPRIFVGEKANDLRIAGKVVATKRKY